MPTDRLCRFAAEAARGKVRAILFHSSFPNDPAERRRPGAHTPKGRGGMGSRFRGNDAEMTQR